jgi:hypothetical protein
LLRISNNILFVLEAETAKALRAFRKEGAKVANFYRQYSKEGKDLRLRKELQDINTVTLCISEASLPSYYFCGLLILYVLFVKLCVVLRTLCGSCLFKLQTYKENIL